MIDTSAVSRRSWFQTVTNFFVSMVQKYLPDPYIFAVILSVVVFIWGIAIGNSPMDMVRFWGNGFWGLLAFSMQMVLVLVTGHALASAPIVDRFLTSIAKSIKSHSMAILLVSFISALACWVNWGFGLVVGALLAKKVAREVKGLDYPLLIGSAYSGFLVWHGGISGSIPLSVATKGHLAYELVGIIPTSQTIFASWNLVIAFVLIFTLPLVNMFMIPRKEDTKEVDSKLLIDEKPEKIKAKNTFALWIENSPLMTILVGAAGLTYIIYWFVTKGFSLDLNIVNFIFLIAGIILHGTPRGYLNALKAAIKGADGIVLQFPFYAGIMGMMVDSGLAALISNWFVSVSNVRTFPMYTFWSAGIINLFVPSGGGQWAVQGPITMPASVALGVDPGKTAMAIAWGDAWTNMIQPFWALPALAIAGLNARDIMGYCLIDLIYSGIVISLLLYLL
ncbi:MAG: short-chain fatty acid transporter [Thermoanaerobacteraceae bacterium]|nr:short-chain fatty acid transporter [Thermoanaerobacteraceae bacterium]